MFPFPAIRFDPRIISCLYQAAYLSSRTKTFGYLFDYCLMYAHCPMKLSRVQPDIYARYAMAKLAREKKVEYGGWVLWDLSRLWRKVLVEVWVYVSGSLTRTGKTSLSLEYPSSHFLRQLLPLLNWEFTGEIEGHDMGFDKYDPSLETFVPSWMEPTFPIRLSLPLTNVPVLKASYVKMTTFVCNYAEGSQPILPMCSMRHKFINLKWIWPVGLPRRREYVQARWHTVREPVRGLIAVRPDIGEAGCRVTVAPEGFDNTGPGAYWGEDVGAATVSSDEGASDDGDEDGELWN
ncbi:uncharacterized protein B0H18DRAFT_957625 [Fomitopsis serialis]|uniref:uncharacterized protein n=1 Tax=Fomitopsis serialis TaxID=139415 RepID=UPI0020082088|nr:uncharacterized protein B0H18DRAFT_957625 [Neoantrodia serialis]KAH9919270.1 hypothetical protein B0H18DRAFT_957625 [Neoantrodia serialis]